MKLFREEGKDVIYLDETWVNFARSCNTTQDAVLVGNMAGLQNPPGSGSSFVIACGSEK